MSKYFENKADLNSCQYIFTTRLFKCHFQPLNNLSMTTLNKNDLNTA